MKQTDEKCKDRKELQESILKKERDIKSGICPGKGFQIGRGSGSFWSLEFGVQIRKLIVDSKLNYDAE